MQVELNITQVLKSDLMLPKRIRDNLKQAEGLYNRCDVEGCEMLKEGDTDVYVYILADRVCRGNECTGARILICSKHFK